MMKNILKVRLKQIYTLTIVFVLVGSIIPRAFAKNINGAGSIFAFPLVKKWIEVYSLFFQKSVNYQPIGSPKGIKQLLTKKVDFAVTNILPDELKENSLSIFHLPICIGTLVISYNLPGKPDLKLTPKVIAQIFMGKILFWDDKNILLLNPTLKLPHLPIKVFYRREAGENLILSTYLTSVSQAWKEKIGQTITFNFTTGTSAKNDKEIAKLITNTSGSIGYLAFPYAYAYGLPMASIQNRTGNFVKPSLLTVSSPTKKMGYPLCSFCWVLFYPKEHYSKEKGVELFQFLSWIIHEGQRYNAPMHFFPLSNNLVRRSEILLNKWKIQ